MKSGMRKTCVALFLTCLAFTPALLRADVVDPGMTIDAGDPPPPTDLSVGVMFTPDPTQQTQVFDFFNDLNGIVTSFTLMTTVAPHFGGVFSCSSGYFLTCSDTYNSTNGALTYSFSGVNPTTGSGICPSSNPACEANDHQGIPIDGLFHFTLTGWTDETG